MKTAYSPLYKTLTAALMGCIAPASYANETEIAERLSFGGLVEVEASYTDDDITGSSSDIVVATVALEVGAQITDNISALVTTLYEEDDTDLEIDVATITLDQLGGMPLSLTLGQNYLPFGVFETYLVNDTLALEIAETRETSAVLRYAQQGFSAAAYVFNGDNESGRQNTIENYGLALSYSNETVAVGVDYISNILESDAELVATPIDNDAVAAYIAHASMNVANVHLATEYLQTDKIADLSNAEISTLQFEIGVDVGQWTLATAYQTSDDAEGILPEQRISLGAATELVENVGLAIEYWNDDNYDDSQSDNIVLQIGVEF